MKEQRTAEELMRIGFKYANDIISGRIVSGRQVILMCQKFISEYENQDDDDFAYYFSENAAAKVLMLDGKLQHYKGRWAGELFYLEPFQIFILMCIFGWRVKANGKRRYTRVYLEMARKNGKTFFAALVAVYMLVFDGEGAPEIYCSATKRDQAKIIFNDIGAIVKKSKFLSKALKVFKTSIVNEATFGKIEALSSESSSLDGLNVFLSICDEVHQWPSRDLYDVLITGMGSRDNPIILSITTAGFDRTSLCWKLHDRAIKISEGILPDKGFFGMVWAVDEDDEITNPEVWIKANPCLGVSKNVDTLVSALDDIEADPSAANSIKRLHFGKWTRASSSYIKAEKWRDCGTYKFDVEKLKGRKCYAGLDLSSTQDVTAYVLLFEPVDEDEPWLAVPKFYVPEETVHERSKAGVPYEEWVDEGLMVATPGPVVDYDYVIAQLLLDMEIYQIENIIYDRYAIQKIRNMVEDKYPGKMVALGQGFYSMDAPTKHLTTMILGKTIAHNNHPVLAWMASNVVVEMNAAGSIKPSKRKSSEKIDGIAALINAIAGSQLIMEEDDQCNDTYGEYEVAVM